MTQEPSHRRSQGLQAEPLSLHPMPWVEKESGTVSCHLALPRACSEGRWAPEGWHFVLCLFPALSGHGSEGPGTYRGSLSSLTSGH